MATGPQCTMSTYCRDYDNKNYVLCHTNAKSCQVLEKFPYQRDVCLSDYQNNMITSLRVCLLISKGCSLLTDTLQYKSVLWHFILWQIYYPSLVLSYTQTVDKNAYLKTRVTLRGKPKPSASQCQVHFIPDEKGFLNLSTSRGLIEYFD